jgi:hypothetical protein
MKKFNTGYGYIDEKIDSLKTKLPEDLRKELDYLLVKAHSLGLSEGYSEGLRSKHLYPEISNN